MRAVTSIVALALAMLSARAFAIAEPVVYGPGTAWYVEYKESEHFTRYSLRGVQEEGWSWESIHINGYVSYNGESQPIDSYDDHDLYEFYYVDEQGRVDVRVITSVVIRLWNYTDPHYYPDWDGQYNPYGDYDPYNPNWKGKSPKGKRKKGAKVVVTASASPSGGGSVSGAGTYEIGQSCNMSATAYDGFGFKEWTGSNGQTISSEAFSFSAYESVAWTATFTNSVAEGYHTMSVDVTPTGAGTATGGGQYADGETATLTATASDGFEFSHWSTPSGDVYGDSVSVTMDGDKSCTAVFTDGRKTVTVTTETEGGGYCIIEDIETGESSDSGSMKVAEGHNYTVTAYENIGYEFVQFEVDGREVKSKVYGKKMGADDETWTLVLRERSGMPACKADGGLILHRPDGKVAGDW